MWRCTLACWLVASTLAAPGAEASIFDTYGFGTRGTAMGNALTAGAEDYHAAYYNPAQLMERLEIHVGMGLSYIQPSLSLTLDDESGATALLPGRNLGFHVGVSTPFGGLFQHKVAFGAVVFVPILRLTRAEFIDPGTPHYYMYENLPDKLLIALALAAEPLDWLRIGIGMQILADLDGSADVTLSLVDQRVSRRRLTIDLHADLAATAGITIVPMEGLNIGVSYREELDLAFTLPVRAMIEEVGLLAFEIDGTSLYTPHQLSFGVSWRLPWVPLTIVADMTWAMWSRAPSPAPTTSLSIDAQHLRDEDPPPKIFDVQSAVVDLEADDIVIARLGLEYTLGAFNLRAGYFYRPTPIPRQVHQTNYVDSDAHVATLGASWTFLDPTRVHKKPLTIGLAFQATILRPRAVEKADAADPVGDYRASGAVFSFGFDFSHDF